MSSGSCLCGAIRWSLASDPKRMTHCHCRMCRKAHGATFATFLIGDLQGFRFEQGEADIVAYESSPDFIRPFCVHCGSVVPHRASDRVRIPAGAMDDDPHILPSAHIYVKWKAPWHAIDDDLPQHDHFPGHSSPRVEDPALSPSTPGVLRGRCLCQAAAYEVKGPLQRLYHCHCSRCRKAKGAAHATNAFAAIDDVRYLRGESSLRTYRLPGARTFSHVFCPTCGSSMPRLDPTRSLAVIPMGSLDDDPERTIDSHIFVASKAPWYEIDDDLPRHDAGPGPS
ncbi:GFA family protein [Thioalkalivibrio sp. HK1]|uniref:GFA family protein n=1 Tax=Thioalkalivibrio sp. HK1 TaxID=1469245 RepID=UPI0012DCF4E6|nr:GFA family protein [Thioalkalivibrio sp. HK1]